MRESDRSERKTGLGLGGDLMTAVTTGVGPESLNATYPNEDGAVMELRLDVMSW